MRADVTNAAPAAQDPQQDKAQEGSGLFGKLRESVKKQGEEQAREEIVKGADRQVRHRLASLKALSPLALAVVKRPGFEADDGELLEAIKQLREETERASGELVTLMGAEGQPTWMVKSIASTVAQYVAAEWEAGVEILDMSPYQPIWGYLADAEFADFEADLPRDPDLDQDTMLRLSMINAMSQVVATTRRSYLMRHDPEKLYPMVAKLIIQTATANLDRIVSPDTSESTRLMALQNLISRCGEVFCSHWDEVVKQTVDYLLGLQSEERLALYREYPTGIPLDKIVQGFSADVARIVGGVAAFDFKPNPVSGEIKIGE